MTAPKHVDWDKPWLACTGWPDHPCYATRCLQAGTCQNPTAGGTHEGRALIEKGEAT